MGAVTSAVTMSLFTGVKEYVVLFVPTLLLFNFHCMVPPVTLVAAVYVTDEPEHTALLPLTEHR